MTLTERLSFEELETAAFYAREVVDEDTYEEIKSVRALPDYGEATPEAMIHLATGVLNGEYRHEVESSTHSEEKWTTGDFVEHVEELSGEPYGTEFRLEQRRPTQLGDEPRDKDEIRLNAKQTRLNIREEPPTQADLDRKKGNHSWLEVVDMTGKHMHKYDAYLPVVDMEDFDDREKPELEEWP